MRRGGSEEAAGNRSQRRFNAFLSLRLYLTCNHIHLLIKDTGNNIIAESMQLVPARVLALISASEAYFGSWAKPKRGWN